MKVHWIVPWFSGNPLDNPTYNLSYVVQLYKTDSRIRGHEIHKGSPSDCPIYPTWYRRLRGHTGMICSPSDCPTYLALYSRIGQTVGLRATLWYR